VKCCQCSTPAMYQVGEQNIPLCLDCYFKFSQIQQQQAENHERMMNYLNDEIAMSVGLAPFGPKRQPTQIRHLFATRIWSLAWRRRLTLIAPDRLRRRMNRHVRRP